jgi:hypothetical protein
MDVGPRALAQHLNHYGRDVFTKLGREHDLEAILGLWEDPNWVPRLDLLSLPDHFLLGFPTGLKNMATIYSSCLQQALAKPIESPTNELPIYDSNSPNSFKQSSYLVCRDDHPW